MGNLKRETRLKFNSHENFIQSFTPNRQINQMHKGEIELSNKMRNIMLMYAVSRNRKCYSDALFELDSTSHAFDQYSHLFRLQPQFRMKEGKPTFFYIFDIFLPQDHLVASVASCISFMRSFKL